MLLVTVSPIRGLREAIVTTIVSKEHYRVVYAGCFNLGGLKPLRTGERDCSTRAPLLPIFKHFEICIFEVSKKCEMSHGDTYKDSEYPWQVLVEISFCLGL